MKLALHSLVKKPPSFNAARLPLALLMTLFACHLWAQDSSAYLWQLGVKDIRDTEFALSPSGYAAFKADGFYAIGRSDPRQDWPYVQPGPVDGWAGGRPHTFTILFGLKGAPANGECKLHIALVDTHSRANPQLKITLNDAVRQHQTPPGGGDDSIYGNPAKGKVHEFEVTFPATALKVGLNELGITTTAGSWMLYDWVGFQAPPGTELSEVSGTSIASVSSPPVLVERDGKLMQVLHLVLRHFGETRDAKISVGGQTLTNLVLNRASQECDLVVPKVEKKTTLSVDLNMSGEKVMAKGIELNPVRKWTVYLLPHSHVDIGYTHVQTEVERAQWRYLETAVETARKSAGYPPGSRFKWNTEVLWAVDSYLKQATPEKQRVFIQAVKDGWVGLDALYGNELTGLCRPEELIRLVTFGAKLAERTGVPIQSAMITDVPGYTWGIVPAFAQAGVKYFSMGPNGGDRIGHTIAAWGDKPFWWLGPNGKNRVLVWMTGTGYYRVFQSPEMLHNYLSGLEAKGYPYDMVQVRHCLGDNGAPDVDFADTVKKWNATYAYPKLIIATTGQMFRDFEKRYGDQLPVAKGDFTPYWEDGAASSARETALNRAAADRLTQAETLFAILSPKSYSASDFDRAWRNVILYDEHTWGAHNSISEPDAAFVKSQWAIKQANALDAARQSAELLELAAKNGVQREQSEAASGPAEFDVFNTCSWERTDLVTLPAELSAMGEQILDANGRRLLAQKRKNGSVVFLAQKVPPFGARRFRVEPGKCPLTSPVMAQGNELRSPELCVRIDPDDGRIVSVYNRKLKGELADASKEGLNSFIYLPDSDPKGLKRNARVKISVEESGPVIASLLIESEAPGCAKLRRGVQLTAGLDRVDIFDEVNKLAIRAKEGVHLGFSFNVPNGALMMDVPWAVVRPELDQIPGACKNWFTVQRWVDISNGDFGITWATPDAPLIEIGGLTANLIGSLADPKLWMNHIEPSQTIYSWAMNNHWHTNYRAEQDGPTLFRYSFYAHKAGGPAEAARFGIGCAQPLIPIPANGAKPKRSLLRVSSPGVLVSALKPTDDGSGLIVRLFAASGKAERTRLVWAEPKPKRVYYSNASEKPLDALSGTLDLPAYGVVTLRAEF